MDRTSRYARGEASTRSCTLSTTAAKGHSQRNKETGEPDDATSIQSGSAGGWEKRPKGPPSQPTQLQSSSSTFACVRFPSFFACQDGMWDTQFSALLSSPTVSARYRYTGHEGHLYRHNVHSNSVYQVAASQHEKRKKESERSAPG